MCDEVRAAVACSLVCFCSWDSGHPKSLVVGSEPWCSHCPKNGRMVGLRFATSAAAAGCAFDRRSFQSARSLCSARLAGVAIRSSQKELLSGTGREAWSVVRCATRSGPRVACLPGVLLFLGQRSPQIARGGFRTVVFSLSQERGMVGLRSAMSAAAGSWVLDRRSFRSAGATPSSSGNATWRTALPKRTPFGNGACGVRRGAWCGAR